MSRVVFSEDGRALSEREHEQGLVVLSGVTKTYAGRGGTLTAVRNVDLNVADGEFLSLVGPSGCGKSTILTMLAGLTSITAGSILVDGQPTHAARSKIGLVPQGDSLLPWRTIHANIEIGLELMRVPAAERRRRSDELIERMGLEGFGQSYPHELSGGMRQRVSIARALIRNPRILIMDEPFGPLDALTRGQLQMLLLELWKDDQKTIIFVTHDLVEAIAMSDRVAVMSARPGEIREVVDIPIPRPRDVFQVHQAPGFEAVHARLWRVLSAASHLSKAADAR